MNPKPKFTSSSVISFIFYILIVLFCYIIYLFSTYGIFAVFGFFIFIPHMILFTLGILITAMIMGWVNSGLFYLKNNSEQGIRTFYTYLVSNAVLIFILFLPITLMFITLDVLVTLLIVTAVITNIIAMNVAIVNDVLESEEE